MKTEDNFIPPLKFRPIYKEYLWGGSAVRRLYNRQDAPRVMAESWEISSSPDGDSEVCGGPFCGETLSSLARRFPLGLIGSKGDGTGRFPLLVKLLDTDRMLSMQVHPSKADSSVSPALIKNECWHFLSAKPGSCCYAGIKNGFSCKEAFVKHTRSSPATLADTAEKHYPDEGDTIMIPAGMLHSIGPGFVIYEVQQNSNITYRLYDWDRVDALGKKRRLSEEEAFRSLDWEARSASVRKGSPCILAGGFEAVRFMESHWFSIYGMDIGSDPAMPDTCGESFHILFAKNGGANVAVRGEMHHIAMGESLLVPACCGRYSLSAEGERSSVLLTTL